jgi:branched-chain amino acid aminotransferase
MNSQLIKMEAIKNGYSEGIALDSMGFISEGSGENIFLVKNGVVRTPPLGSSVLPGITRSVVIQICQDLGFELQQEMIAREFLYLADEVFFTGTAAEVTPVRSVDKITVGGGSRGPLTAKIQERFFDVVRGTGEDKHSWLTFVR